MDRLYGETKFDDLYAAFMLLFGVTTVLLVIGTAIFLLLAFHIIAILFLSPLFIGIWYGIRKYDEGWENPLALETQPVLKEIIAELHEETGISVPNYVHITNDSSVAVTGLWKKRLLIGLIALRFLTKSELKAIIAHEYGHYSGRDTVMGYWVYRISRFMDVQTEVNKQALRFDIMIVVHLPSFIIFWLISRYYHLLIFWHKRRREYRADAFAAQTIGPQQFADALVKYIVITDLFDTVAPQHVLHYLQQGQQIINIYDYITPLYTDKNIDLAVEKALEHRSGWNDTHPSLSERLENLGVKHVTVNISSKHKSLLKDSKLLEQEASALLTQKMALWAHLMGVYEGAEED
jgi:Zn-dependent protease with chaperone function